MAQSQDEREADGKRQVALATFLHVAVFVGSYFYYGTVPKVQLNTDPSLPVLTMENIPGQVVMSGLLTLTLIPIVVELFEYKRTNPNFWGNVAANQWNSLTCIPTEMLCLPFMCRNITPPGSGWGTIALDTVIYLMMADLWFYWTHRMFHNVPFLWQFHVTHHNLNPAKGVSAIAAASTSAIDFTITHLPMIWWPFFVRKFCFEACIFSFVFMITWLTFIHSYSFWSYDSRIMMDPTNHRVHHGWGRTNNYNFAAFTTVYDRAFGTYRSEKEMKAAWKRGEKEEVAAADWSGVKKLAEQKVPEPDAKAKPVPVVAVKKQRVDTPRAKVKA
jgi:sterol desaturase/sphingolipid hydroxylase (fatty acid hydroxylase superfamily)